MIGQESFWSSNDRHSKKENEGEKKKKEANKIKTTIQSKVMTGWQMNREKQTKKQNKSSFCKNVRECRIITITTIVKWLLHFSFVLQTGAEFPWLP